MVSPPADRSVHCMKLIVTPSDIDDLNHVNNVVYLGWVQDAAAAHWMAVGPDELRRQCRWVVVRHEIDYLASAVLGDELEVYTWVDMPTGPRQTRHVSIQRSRDHEVIAYAQSTWVLLDPVTGRPKRIPDAIKTTFGLKGE